MDNDNIDKTVPYKMDKKERVWVVVLVKDISRTYTIVASRPSNQGVATKIVIIYDRLPLDRTDRQDLRVR